MLENGEMLGGTGLSNPMKYYSGLEKNLCLKARRSGSGYVLSGRLPSVSNLGPDHGFGVVAQAEDDNRIVAFVRCSSQGLTLKEKTYYLGLNGSATYLCDFNEVWVPDEWIVSEQADEFVARIRSRFLLYQIPLGLGVASAAIDSMYSAKGRQGGCSRFIKEQPEDLEQELQQCRENVYELAARAGDALEWQDAVQVRLDVTYLTLKAVQAGMLHCGGSGYIQTSDPSRRLREAYFMANLTPTVKHLEKMSYLHSMV